MKVTVLQLELVILVMHMLLSMLLAFLVQMLVILVVVWLVCIVTPLKLKIVTIQLLDSRDWGIKDY